MKYVGSKSVEALLTPFRLDMVQQIEAPEGCDGVWQRYVISQGSNTIVGMRCGAQVDVNRALNEIVERLNLRFTKQQSKEAERSHKKTRVVERAPAAAVAVEVEVAPSDAQPT